MTGWGVLPAGGLALLLACGGHGGPARTPAPEGWTSRSATLASLRIGRLSGGGDYFLSAHPSRTTGLAVNEELRLAPGGPMTLLVLRASVPETDRRGAAPAGFEVVRTDASKILLRYAPPAGSGERTFQIDPGGATELVIRPVSEGRGLTVVRGSSRVDWIEPPDTGAAR